MCWNEPVSWTTFIVGTVCNLASALYIKNTMFTGVCIMWEWILLMQLFEALAWHDQNCGKLNRCATYGAYLANITQPFVILFSLLVSDTKMLAKLIAAILVFIYSTWLLVIAKSPTKYECLTPNKDCRHLSFPWWKDLRTLVPMYIICVLLLPILLIRPWCFGFFQSFYIGITAIITWIFYSCAGAGSIGSVWCWFAALVPIFNVFVYKLCTKYI